MDQLRVCLLHRDAKPPTKAYAGDAGFDLYVLEWTVIHPHQTIDVRSGVAIEVPDGYYTRIVGRSSTLRKRRLVVHEGIIDSGFRGELFAAATNVGDYLVGLRAGESIAQLIVQRYEGTDVHIVSRLSNSERGTNGFGSSGG